MGPRAFLGSAVELTVVQYGNEKFSEEHRVKMGEYFYIHDTAYQARVTHYVPHFERSISKATVTSRTNDMINPAIKVELIHNGNKVYQMFANYQTRAFGGEGYLRIIDLDPATYKVSVKTFSPWRNSYFTDSNNQFEFENVVFSAPIPRTTLF